MAKKIVLIAEFNNPLHADDAMSNLTEAEYKPIQTQKDRKVIITIPVDQNSLDSAKEILADAQAEQISQKKLPNEK